LIGYESFIRGKNARHVLDRFAAPSLEFKDEIVEMDTHCKQFALSHYNATAPLFINSHPYSSDPFPSPPFSHPQHDLVIEITEQTFLRDERSLSINVERLVTRGVHFAIDDFGFGHFSLPFILTIHPTYIKLAKEVVHSCSNKKPLDVLKKLLAPFEEVGIQIIAEGIETEQQFEQMQSLASAFQGYLFAFPAMLQKVVR
jgi:EAL domain-containing protein (putative c-di-GMP-specific phosphodiesterase class I)